MTFVSPQEMIAPFVVEQGYERYTEADQNTWKTILTSSVAFWQTHAHPDFLPGMEKTGIGLDRIPHIDHINQCLAPFGWGAVPVDGFVPPRIFLLLHAQGLLPITRDIRKPENLKYTPAPDIVHEAAGHVPMLSHPIYAAFMKRFGELSMKAGFSEHDYEIFEAIRHLSNIKEDRQATPEEIEAAERRLAAVYNEESEISTGMLLSRLYWWTVEYGLMGTLDDPKIYGAGLISSVGESRHCLSEAVEKLPLSLDCLEVPYNITEPQPQLFVARDFNEMFELLESFAEKYLLKQCA